MISLAYHASDAATAARLSEDLGQAGYAVGTETSGGRDQVLLALVSPAAVTDAAIMQRVYDALDAGSVLITVVISPVEVPALLADLPRADLSSRYDFAAVRARIDAAQATTGFRPRVVTPKVRQSNRRTLAWVSIIALVVFAFSLWAISTFHLQAPAENYSRFATDDAMTRDAIIGPTMAYLSTSLPRSTEQAAVFPATLQAVPTRIRPFVAGTATAIYNALAGIYPTPIPTATPGSRYESDF